MYRNHAQWLKLICKGMPKALSLFLSQALKHTFIIYRNGYYYFYYWKQSYNLVLLDSKPA